MVGSVRSRRDRRVRSWSRWVGRSVWWVWCDQVRRVRSYPNDFSAGLGFAHDRGQGLRSWSAAMSDLRGFMFPRSATGRSSLVPPPPWHYSGQMLTIEYRTDPAAVAELLPPPLEPAAEDPGAVAIIWADWQIVQRHVRGAARPGALAVRRDVRRRALLVPRRDVQPLRLHLGRQGLRHGPRPPPGVPQEARRAARHPPVNVGVPDPGWSRAGGSGRRARCTAGG